MRPRARATAAGSMGRPSASWTLSFTLRSDRRPTPRTAHLMSSGRSCTRTRSSWRPFTTSCSIHVVVLARGVEGLHSALDVAVAEGPARSEAALLEHLLAVESPRPEHHDGVGRDAGGWAGRGGRGGRALRARGARDEHGQTQQDDGGKLADHAFEPESARNANRSLSGATSTSTSSPRANSPTRIFSDSGSSTYFCIARFSGRAPKCSS